MIEWSQKFFPRNHVNLNEGQDIKMGTKQWSLSLYQVDKKGQVGS